MHTGFCFAVLCWGYTLTDFPISIRLTSLALWQSNDCPSASKATLMNMDKYFIWIHYERLHNHNKQSTTKPCAYFLGYTVSIEQQRTLTYLAGVRYIVMNIMPLTHTHKRAHTHTHTHTDIYAHCCFLILPWTNCCTHSRVSGGLRRNEHHMTPLVIQGLDPRIETIISCHVAGLPIMSAHSKLPIQMHY